LPRQKSDGDRQKSDKPSATGSAETKQRRAEVAQRLDPLADPPPRRRVEASLAVPREEAQWQQY
jgi:hypothetical protein